MWICQRPPSSYAEPFQSDANRPFSGVNDPTCSLHLTPDEAASRRPRSRTAHRRSIQRRSPGPVPSPVPWSGSGPIHSVRVLFYSPLGPVPDLIVHLFRLGRSTRTAYGLARLVSLVRLARGRDRSPEYQSPNSGTQHGSHLPSAAGPRLGRRRSAELAAVRRDAAARFAPSLVPGERLSDSSLGSAHIARTRASA